MLQANPRRVRYAVAVPQSRTIVRGGRPGRIEARASRQLDSHGPVASRDVSEDWSVVQRAIVGNADAQEDLFGRRTNALYRAAFSILRNKEDAEDAVQEALCKAYISLGSFQGRSSFSSWLTRIVINSALMARRRKRTRPEASLDEILNSPAERLPLAVADTRPNPEKICAATETNALVEEHVLQLPPLLRAAFRLRTTYDFTIRESSIALGIRASAYKSRVCRARQKLTRELRQSLETGGDASGLRTRERGQ
jgi:RNA polymerase sigma factor (sigma-70 family)